MSLKTFPRSPSLRHFKNQAKDLYKAISSPSKGVYAEEGEALEGWRRLCASHPRWVGVSEDKAASQEVSLSDAQLVIAREYGFASWGRLRDCTLAIERYGTSPHQAPKDSARDDAAGRANEFLRLVCLTYGNDHPSRRQQAAEMLVAHPEIALESIHTVAALGDVAAARAMLTAQPELARLPGGPHGWEPILYLAYARPELPIEGSDPVEVARLLLAHGADANAGYLWNNEPYVFTALTGVFGEGESGPVNQPRHPNEMELVRVLLEAGADANDTQTVYNRQFTPGTSHLEILLAYGLGGKSKGPWYARLGGQIPEPREMLEGQLIWAAEHGFRDRVALLAKAGVDLNCTGHRKRTPYETALLHGHAEIADDLLKFGASRQALAPEEELIVAIHAGNRDRVTALQQENPGLPDSLGERRVHILIAAVAANQIAAVRLMIELGFPVNTTIRSSALHEAAWHGDLDLARLLVEHGADRDQRDPTHDARPLDWARYNNQTLVAEYLEGLDAA